LINFTQANRISTTSKKRASKEYGTKRVPRYVLKRAIVEGLVTLPDYSSGAYLYAHLRKSPNRQEFSLLSTLIAFVLMIRRSLI